MKWTHLQAAADEQVGGLRTGSGTSDGHQAIGSALHELIPAIQCSQVFFTWCFFLLHKQ